MSLETNNPFPITKKIYDVTYRNEYDQIDTLQATLIHTFAESFLVFIHKEKVLLMPKDRILMLRETTIPSVATVPNPIAQKA
jgi:hypothetical protein